MHTPPCAAGLELHHGFLEVQLLGELRTPGALFQQDRILREATAAGGAVVIGDHLVDLLVGLRTEIHGPPLTLPYHQYHCLQMNRLRPFHQINVSISSLDWVRYRQLCKEGALCPKWTVPL